jgi:hypothetical protein
MMRTASGFAFAVPATSCELIACFFHAVTYRPSTGLLSLCWLSDLLCLPVWQPRKGECHDLRPQLALRIAAKLAVQTCDKCPALWS